MDDLEKLLEGDAPRLAANSRSKAEHAVKAVKSGVNRVHVLDGRVFDGLLNEIFSNDGVGSLVYGNDYQQIRQAQRRDVRFIYSLTRSAVKREELLHRTQQAIEKNIEQFYVYEIDENIIACVTLSFYPGKVPMAEVGSVYVLPFYHNRGIGKKMVEYACLMAKERGAKRVIALSTQSFGFFTAVCGFEETTKEALPEARLKVPRAMVMEELKTAGIGSQVHYPAIHRFKLYRKLGWKDGDFPHAEYAGRNILTIPLFPAMADGDVDRVVAALMEILLMLFLGYETGQLFGWSRMDSIFLGAILSISSTTIIAVS